MGTFPDDCDECGHQVCKRPEDDGGILVNCVGWVCQCIPKWLAGERQLLLAVHTGLAAWRHWKNGCLQAFYPEPSQALGNLILMIDDAAHEYRQDLQPKRTER